MQVPSLAKFFQKRHPSAIAAPAPAPDRVSLRPFDPGMRQTPGGDMNTCIELALRADGSPAYGVPWIFHGIAGG